MSPLARWQVRFFFRRGALGLNPPPASAMFDRSLHFVGRLVPA